MDGTVCPDAAGTAQGTVEVLARTSNKAKTIAAATNAPGLNFSLGRFTDAAPKTPAAHD